MNELESYINHRNSESFLLDFAVILFYDRLNRIMKILEEGNYSKEQILDEFGLYMTPNTIETDDSTELVFKIGNDLKEIESLDENTKTTLNKISNLFGKNPFKESDNAIKSFYLDLTHSEAPNYKEFFHDLIKRSSKINSNESLQDLIIKLGVSSSDSINSIFNPDSEINTLLIKAHEMRKDIKLYGQEVDERFRVLGFINLFFNGINLDPVKSKITIPNNSDKEVYDLIVSEIPFNHSKDSNYSKITIEKIDQYLDLLADTGLAVLQVSQDFLSSNGLEQNFRQDLIESNYVDSIIRLPVDIIKNSSEAPSLMILRKNKANERIRFIDASEEIIKGRNPRFSEENIEKIISAYLMKDSSNLTIEEIGRERILKENFNLSPHLYFRPDYSEKYLEWDYLKDNVQVLNYGNNTSSKLREEEESENISYLIEVNDLNKKRITDIKTLKEIYDSNSKIHLIQGDILIPQNFNSFKAALYDLETEGPVFASDEILVLRPNKQKINPYYLLTYLNSGEGRHQFESLFNNQKSLKTLDQSIIEKIIIPLKDLKEQEEIGNTYKSFLEERERILEELTERERQLGTVFD